MKLANRPDRTILVIGIGITTFLLLWSMSTATAKAGELEQSTVPAGSPVSGASTVLHKFSDHHHTASGKPL